ncbi:MAG: BamA/TamA family outer membrane protein [Candidatus Marinimicrobia bacterium]|nr:BamA/TamA family outer membrane protein [Candidatus Neomarinimicrobiota bacterium]
MKFSQFWYLIGLFLISNIYADEILYISEIKFIGNFALDDDELQSVINLQSPKLFSRSEFSPKKFNRDKISLEAYYKTKGFLNIGITDKYELISENYVKIQFFINEGDQFKLREIHFFGNKQFSDNEILMMLDTPTNNNFNPSKIRRQLKSLKRNYLTRGKIDVSIMDEVKIEGINVITRINIFEGISYYIQGISISGLESVKEKYVFREILFKKDDIYNIDKIDESRKRIFDSGLFSSVEIINKLINKEEGLVDIEIKVREYKSSSIEAKFGFKELTAFQENLTTTGIDAQARWVLGNIFNTTSNVEFTGRIASSINLNIFTHNPLIERDFTVIYRTPWTFHFRIPTRIKYFHNEESEEYDLTRDGLTYSLLFNQRKTKRYEFNSTFEIIQSDDSLYTDEKKEPARWMNVKYLSNNIQNPINPIGGKYFSFIATLYGTILGGDRNFVKFEAEYRKYLRIQNNSTFALRIVLGYINNMETENDLPLAYKFHLGGQTSLRGWASADNFENPRGANISDMINLEYRFPIKNNFGGEIFFDAGRLYETMNAFMDTSVSWDYGVGIIYQTALGPIRIDVGFPYGKLANPQIHASLLYLF